MTSHNVIKSTAYIDEMKDSVTKITNKFMDALNGREKSIFEKIFHCTKMINDSLRTITVLRKDMEEARDLMKGVKIVEGIAPTQTLSEAAKFLGLKWNLQDVNLNLQAVMAKKEGGTAEEEKEKEESKADEQEEVKEKEEESPGRDSVNNGEEEASETGTNEEEKADDENEKDVDEEENLSEEEKRKRAKIQKLKERLAAATLAAEQAKLDSKEKIGSKKEKTVSSRPKKTEDEIKGDKTLDENKENKSSTLTGREAFSSTSRNLKTWQKKLKSYEPIPREPSITPEREIQASKTTKSQDQEDTEKKANDKEVNNKTEENKDTGENRIKAGRSKEDIRTEANPESKKETEVSAKTSAKATNNAESTETNSTSGTNSDAKTEGISETKKASASAIKRPRGRLARNALKRAQTMDFSKKIENEENDNSKENESDDIKGLDLETHKTNKNNEETGLDNKEADAQASSENKEEIEEPKVEETVEKKKKEEEKDDKDMFEMEPEEKERIATELLQVPSLTVCIEGVGGLLARVSWESLGLHIYCHQFQELPYDVIIKSNVLQALIPTRDPMVFLDIATDDQNLGRIYITLMGHLRRANNFLLLCLGDRGRSLKLSRFFGVLNSDCPGERLQGGDYEYNNGRGGEALIDDLEYQGKYSMPMEMGLVTSATSGNRALDSQFYICTEEDLNRQFACPFGRVTLGLPVLKEAVWLVVTQQVYIQDCGVVLDCPRI